MDIIKLSTIDSLVLTPTNRLERQFSALYAKQQVSQGVSVWVPPAFSALSTWLTKTWLSLQDSGYQLAAGKARATNQQILALWTKAIEAFPLDGTALSSTALALSAADANKIIRRWGVTPEQLAEGGTLEIEQFKKWRSAFGSSMERANWVDDEDVMAIVTQAIIDGAVLLPKTVYLYAFDEIPPLTEAFINAINATRSEVVHYGFESQVSTVVRTSVRQRQDQIEAAACWAKAKLAENPNAKIGIVCPELSKQRREISETFAKVFEPQYVLPTEARYTLPFNFSAGVPLADICLVRDAVDFLSLGVSDAHVTEVSKLIRSPYIVGHITEFSSRSSFDDRIKARGSKKVSLASVVTIHGAPPLLKESIGRFLLHTGNRPVHQKPSQWAVFFSQALEKLGWPGDRQLDSEEYQALLHWHSVLEELSKLDFVFPECSYNRAISMLQQILVSEVFQSQTKDSPIQILGVLEASGLSFDAEWVIDMNDDIWPAPAKPSPFIPLHLQKSLYMPHASADRELAFAKKMVDRLMHSSSEVVFSYAELDNDRELRCSSIIDGVERKELQELDLDRPSTYSSLLFGAVNGAPIIDGNLSIADGENVRGGTGILKAQQECPFQAFAKYRLRATEASESQLGLSPIERGDVVHLVMEHIWKTLKSQDDLVSLSDDEITALINESIDNAFFWLNGRRGDIGPRFLKIERERLLSLVSEWLQLERERAPFTVQSVEHTRQTKIGRLPIRIKIDRVDEVACKEFYIDYKTGRSSLSGWNPESLVAPQVPIYVVTGESESSGGAFAQIRQGDLQLKGISDQAGESGIVEPGKARAGLPSTWEETKLLWKNRLEEVAEEFMSGNAAVAPQRKSICQGCHLSGLCRRA